MDGQSVGEPDTSEDNVKPLKSAILTTESGLRVECKLIENERALSVEVLNTGGYGTGLDLSALYDEQPAKS